MASNRIVRVLSIFGFLLLMAPFYDSCNGRGFKKEVAIEEVPSIEADTIVFANDTVSKVPFYQKGYDFIDDSKNENAFELAYISKVVFDDPFDKLIKDIKKEFSQRKFEIVFFIIRSFSFVLLVFFSLATLVLAQIKRYWWVWKLSLANLILIVITFCCIVFSDPLFETFRQIKWGYYVFTIVQILILYFSKKKLQEREPFGRA